MTSTRSLLLVLTCAAMTSASAQTIGWNLDQFGTINSSAATGIVPATNWTNTVPPGSSPLSAGVNNLIDNTGAATTMDITYSAWGAWKIQASDPGADANGSNNKRLLNGYLNAGPAAWNPPVTQSSVLLSEVPYNLYNIVVYFSADQGGREGQVTIGSTTYYFSSLGTAAISGANATLTQTTSTSNSTYTTANYAVFTGLTGTSQSIAVQMRDNDEWGGIAGFQVVAVPEPSQTAAMVGGLCLLALFMRSRRRA